MVTMGQFESKSLHRAGQSLAGELVGSELLGEQAFHVHVEASPVNLPPALVSISLMPKLVPFLGFYGFLWLSVPWFNRHLNYMVVF